MYKLVIFDCDGTLVDSEIVANRIFAQGMTGLGCPLNAEECIKKFSGTTVEYVKNYMQQEYGLCIPDAFFHEKLKETKQAFQTELRPLMHDVLYYVQEKNMQRCVASNSSVSWIEGALRSTDQMKFFSREHIFSVEHVAQGKPAPDLFLHAAAAMQCNPEECLVIEDSTAGIQAAQAANMPVIGFLGATHAQFGWYQERLKIYNVPLMHSAQDIVKYICDGAV